MILYIIIFISLLLFILACSLLKTRYKLHLLEKITKNVHQTWKNYQLPPDFIRYQNTIFKYMNDYKYFFWTDETLDLLIKNDFPELYEFWISLSPKIKQIDMAKYLIVYKHGGFFIDFDMEIFKDPTPLITSSVVIGSPAIFYSTPNHSFWLEVIDYIKNNKDRDVLNATGPYALKRCQKKSKHKRDIIFLEEKIFFPIDYDNKDEDSCVNSLCKDKYISNSYGAHHYAGTWIKK
ncbi:glycosyltransferase [Aureispira]|nr:glycosyltransferase [Aureispira sp.]